MTGRCRRWSCPVHGKSRAARRHRTRIEHQRRENHAEWARYVRRLCRTGLFAEDDIPSGRRVALTSQHRIAL